MTRAMTSATPAETANAISAMGRESPACGVPEPPEPPPFEGLERTTVPEVLEVESEEPFETWVEEVSP